jgi:hypothetical protein
MSGHFGKKGFGFRLVSGEEWRLSQKQKCPDIREKSDLQNTIKDFQGIRAS